MPYPFRVALFYRADEASIDPENLPLPVVRIDDDLDWRDQPPGGDYRVVFYATNGGLSTSPVRTGQEARRLELWPPSNTYGDADLFQVYWHLDCLASDTVHLEIYPISPWLRDCPLPS
jgi:hypothetical protein